MRNVKIRRQYKMPVTEVQKKTKKPRAHAVESSQSLDPITIFIRWQDEQLPKKGFKMNFRKESFQCGLRNSTKIP